MTEGTTVVGYVRVSTDEQGVSGLGLEAQKRAIRDACKRRGWTLVRYEQDVESGRTMKNRPGLTAALDSCRSGEVGGIVVSKLDRLTRSLADFAALLLEAQGRFNVVTLDPDVDLSTPSGKFLANILASAAEWEREVIGQRTRDALAVKRAQGVQLGRPPAPVPPNVRRRIKRLRQKGDSLSEIARRLNADGAPTPAGTRWWATTVKRVLGDG